MSIAGFSEGFSDGVVAGTALGKGIREGRSARSMGAATKILAEMQGMAPGTGSAAGIPDGQGNSNKTPTGYSGNEWESAKQRYIASMKGISDPAILERMMDQMADMEKGKTLEYGRMALASIKNGDMDAAQRYLAGVSYFTDPGNTPTINVAPDGTVLMASEGERPTILTPDNLEEFLHQMVDYEGWRDFTFKQNEHSDMMDYREKVLASEAADRMARTEIAGRTADANIARDEASVARYAVQNAQTKQEMELARKNYEAGVDSARIARTEKIVADANAFLKEYMEDPGAVSPTSKGSDDLLGLGAPTSALPADAQGIVDVNDAATKVADSSTAQQQSETRMQKAAFRNALAANGGGAMLDFQSIVEAIARGNPDISGTRAGAAAVRAFASDAREVDPATGQPMNDAFFDPESGELVLVSGGRKDYYKIHPSSMPIMAGMFGPPPKAPEPAGPGALPQEPPAEAAAPPQGQPAPQATGIPPN